MSQWRKMLVRFIRATVWKTYLVYVIFVEHVALRAGQAQYCWKTEAVHGEYLNIKAVLSSR